MFSRNGANGPESNARMFRPVYQVSASVGRQTTCLVEFARKFAPGTKSVVFDCIF